MYQAFLLIVTAAYSRLVSFNMLPILRGMQVRSDLSVSVTTHMYFDYL